MCCQVRLSQHQVAQGDDASDADDDGADEEEEIHFGRSSGVVSSQPQFGQMQPVQPADAVMQQPQSGYEEDDDDEDDDGRQDSVGGFQWNPNMGQSGTNGGDRKRFF